jgi:predicted PolB exonuclease-like 3'-5' exonuclease
LGQKRRTQRGGSVLNAPNGSVVIVRDKGDKYSPFIAIDKQEAEEADF